MKKKIRLLKKCPSCNSTRINNVLEVENGNVYLIRFCDKCKNFKNITKLVGVKNREVRYDFEEDFT